MAKLPVVPMAKELRRTMEKPMPVAPLKMAKHPHMNLGKFLHPKKSR